MLFNETPCQHPIIIIKDMSYNHLKTLIEFMYYGEVNISQDQLPVILKVCFYLLQYVYFLAIIYHY